MSTERFFRAGYNDKLLGSWLPALEGVQQKLTSGARAADVGPLGSGGDDGGASE